MTIILIIIIGVLLFVLKDKIFGDGKSSAGNKTTYFPPSNSYSVPSKTIAPKLSVWQKFRKMNPQEAAEIETVSEINMDELDDKAAEELIFTFQYWAKKSGCSIIDLKQDFYDKSEAVFELLSYEENMRLMDENKLKFARTHNMNPDNTLFSFMQKWYSEKQSIKETESEGKFSFTRALSEKKEKNKHNEVEAQRLWNLAKETVDLISNEHKKLSDKGRLEALLYCTAYLFENPSVSKLENPVEIFVGQHLAHELDKYSVLNNDFYGKRIDFYQEEIAKLSNDPYYSPMFIYNAFYLNPLCENPRNMLDDFPVLEVMTFDLFLKVVNNHLNENK